MHKLLLLSFLLSAIAGWSQQQSAQNRVEWEKLLAVSASYDKTAIVSEQALAPFPVYKINGEWHVSLFGKRLANADWTVLEDHHVLKGASVGIITTIKVPLNELHLIDLSRFYSYLEIPAKVAPTLDKAVKDTHADSVQKGFNLPEAFTGKDVYIGITDWGFDYGHPMFYDTLLTTSRVAAAWDQFKQSGPAPTGFSYGAEYDTPAELVAAETDTTNFYGHHTHGSHVAGIAGGSGAGTNYRGLAFESQFLFTTFMIDAAAAIDAFVWMKNKAQADGKRLVINMSWGLYHMGTLDGNSLLSQAINELSIGDNVVFVASAGNNGNVNFHIKKTFTNDEFSSVVSFYSYAANASMWGQSISMWGEDGHPFEAKVEVYNTSNTLLASSPFYGTATTASYVDSILVTGTDTIFFNVSAESSNPLNNRPGMRLRVKNTDTSLKVVLTARAADGTVHFWNLVELMNGAGNWGQNLTTFGNNGITGDAKYSIGEPTCAAEVITVAAYSSGYTLANGNPAGGAVASFTSYGPLYNEVMKPDIAAPGVNVASSISSYTDASYTAVATINFNGKDYDFAKFSGTSMSSPCVAGIVALMLDANPSLNPLQIKEIIKLTARLDTHTGAIVAPGDYRWGMGKINAYQAVVLALNTISLEELTSGQWMTVYPNPSNGTIYLLLPENAALSNFVLTGMDGRTHEVELKNTQLDVSQLPAGTYIATAVVNGKAVHTKLVKAN